MRLRTRAREVAREQSRGAVAWSRAVTPGRLGRAPEFLVIGGMRCGTTSLFHYLASHPDVMPALGKELHFFTLHYGRGLRWYRGHFPQRGDQLSFEASPYYLFHPAVPQRVAETLPEVKLVALLRNPVERAYSHYLHTRRRGFEPLSFADALDAEPARLQNPGSTASQDPTRLYSYVSRGRYAEQLERWFAHFPRERLHVIRSEDLFTGRPVALDGLTDFLGISPCSSSHFDRHAATAAEPVPQLTNAVRRELEARFAEPNSRLAELLGWTSTWPPAALVG